jgi:hypothetical protein
MKGSNKKVKVASVHKKNSSLGSLLDSTKKYVGQKKKTEFMSSGKAADSAQSQKARPDKFVESPVRFEPMSTPSNEYTLLKH